MPRVAMTSARLCAAHPSARSPRTAEQAAAGGCVLQADIGGRDCAKTWQEAATRTPDTALMRTKEFHISFSRITMFWGTGGNLEMRPAAAYARRRPATSDAPKSY